MPFPVSLIWITHYICKCIHCGVSECQILQASRYKYSWATIHPNYGEKLLGLYSQKGSSSSWAKDQLKFCINSCKTWADFWLNFSLIPFVNTKPGFFPYFFYRRKYWHNPKIFCIKRLQTVSEFPRHFFSECNKLSDNNKKYRNNHSFSPRKTWDGQQEFSRIYIRMPAILDTQTDHNICTCKCNGLFISKGLIVGWFPMVAKYRIYKLHLSQTGKCTCTVKHGLLGLIRPLAIIFYHVYANKSSVWRKQFNGKNRVQKFLPISTVFWT